MNSQLEYLQSGFVAIDVERQLERENLQLIEKEGVGSSPDATWDESMTGLLSTPTVAAVSLLCKVFLNSPFCSVTVNGLPTLLEALNSEQRRTDRGIVTGETLSLGFFPLRSDIQQFPTTYLCRFALIHRRIRLNVCSD
jgi:hypothetical protein